MNRLRGSGKLFSQSVPQLRNNMRHKALRSWTAIQDTYFSTKDVFESHKVVFTVGTSIASVATAWIGYTVRHLHDTRVDKRLESIEKTIKEKNHHIEGSEIREVMGSGSISLSSCIATAGTTLIIGYALGWRGGRWFANKQFRKEQMKLLGHAKPKRWQLLRQRIQPKVWQFQFLKRPLLKHKTSEMVVKTCEKSKDAQTTHNLENSVNLVSKQMS